jgi:hypothetical protein
VVGNQQQAQAGASFFNFPPHPQVPSLFSGNPFFSGAPQESAELSAAIGGDLLKDVDAANEDTFGPASLAPVMSDLSPPPPPMAPNPFGSPLGNGSGGMPFGGFSDLKTDSAPFSPPNKRTQSRFGFPSGSSGNKDDEEGSNFSLFG